MDLKLIQRLIRLMDRGDLLEIEVQEGEKRVKLRRAEPQGPASVSFHPSPALLAAGAPSAPGAAPATAAADGTVEFRSPMVGTFYKAASPEAEPFVSKGSKINAESVLCIVEAMKVMNEIKAEIEGEIVEILAKNGEPVEFGQPLFLIRPSR